MYRRVLTILFFILCAPVQAQSDRAGASDYPGVERFPQSYIVDYRSSDVPEYRLILGGLEKVNGVIRPEQEERIRGTLTRITYQIPDSHDSIEPFNFIKQQLQGTGAEVVFECHGRECGSSNYWANSIFRYSRLYGVDASQHYMAVKRGAETFVLYTIKRGNKRVYAHLEVVEKQGNGFVVALREQGFALLTDLDAQLPLVVEIMQEQPQLSAWLVSFDLASGDLADALEQSRIAAETVKSRMLALQMEPGRIQVFPAGAVVPMLAREADAGVYIVLK